MAPGVRMKRKATAFPQKREGEISGGGGETGGCEKTWVSYPEPNPKPSPFPDTDAGSVRVLEFSLGGDEEGVGCTTTQEAFSSANPPQSWGRV